MADKKIGGRFFRAAPGLATEGIKLQVRIMRLAGPALKSLPILFAAKAAGVKVEEDAASRSIALQALGDVFSNADPDEVADFIRDVVERAMVSDDGKTYENVIMDQHFQGPEVSQIYPLVLFVLEEQLGDFFTGELGLGSLGKKDQG